MLTRQTLDATVNPEPLRPETCTQNPKQPETPLKPKPKNLRHLLL